MGQAYYRAWAELVPLRRWEWWLQCSWIGPGEQAWLRKAETKLRALADRKGATLIGDPMSYTKERDGRIVVCADAIVSAPFDPDAPVERGPAGCDA